MAYFAIAFIAPNYRDYKNQWLKAYEPGTTTPKAMALDSAAAVTVAKLQLNADGFLKSAGDALVIPYIEGAYDLWLFPTSAEADANDTSSAVRVADDINSTNLSLINDLSQAYGFTTVAAYKAFTTAFPDGKIINIAEFFSGTGGGASYIKTTGTGTANDKDIIASSSINQSIQLTVEDGTVLLSQLGAVIASDNSAIIQYAYDTYDVIVYDNLYPNSGTVITKDNTKVIANDGVSGPVNNDTEQTMLGVNANHVTLDGLVIDGNSTKAHTQGMVRLYQEKSNFTAVNNKFQNVVGNLTSNPSGVKQYALSIDTFGCTDVNIQNNTFENIIGYDQNDAQAGNGFAGGMYISSDESGKNETNNTNPSSGIISTNKFIDIATAGIDGDISHSDAEGIRIFQTQLVPPAFVAFDFKMDNNYFRGIQKSAIKASGTGGLKISNCTIISDNSADPDASGLPMLASMRLQEGSNSHVTDTTLSGNFTHGIVMFCADTVVDGLFLASGEILNSAIYIFSSNYTSPSVHDIYISNLRLKKTSVIVNTAITSGATSNVVFRDVYVSDVRVDGFGTLDPVNFRFNNVDGISLNDIHTEDPLFNTELCYSFRDCDRVKMSNIYGETTDQGIDENETTTTVRATDYKLSNVEFYASDGREGKSTRFINLRNSGNSSRNAVENVEILGLTVSTPSMTVTGNHDILLVESPSCKIDNFTTTVRNTTGVNRPQTGLNLLNAKQGSMITNVSIIEEKALVGDKYVITASTCDKTQIRGVSGGGRGVNLAAGDNILVSEVTSTLSSLVSAGATNVVTSDIVTWV